MDLETYRSRYGKDGAPGWESIDAALAKVYGDREPDRHFAATPHFAAGGGNPLDGISIYRREDHLHYVSYGMSELYYAEETLETELSGWGFEFTFRLSRDAEVDAEQDGLPGWPAELMQNLARYVHESGRWFEPGHHLNARGPIKAGADTAIWAIMFIQDPELGLIDTPHGSVEFLQLVGLTMDEYQDLASNQTDTGTLIDRLRAIDKLLATSMSRQ